MTSIPKGFAKSSDPENHKLSTGTLELAIQGSDRPELYRIAERQNPKRAFLFVSTILGRHIPVKPRDHRASLEALADRIAPLLLEGSAFVMGYAETAVGIGAGVFDVLRDKFGEDRFGYLHTTRHPVEGDDVWFTIEEGHSHATHHTIMRPRGGVCRPGPASTLVLVDDETTTGSTFAQLAEGLWQNGATFGRVILVTLMDWSAGRAEARLKETLGLDEIHSVSLLNGSWVWQPDEGVTPPALPAAGTPECPTWTPDPDTLYQAPRTGLKRREMSNGLYLAMKLKLPRLKKSEKRVLVIGSGEHVWQPFLYAEALCQEGIDTGFVATTRSPIMPGPVIRHKITFPDHFGIGLDMYLHNVNPDDWDRIVLFTETEASGVPEALRQGLGKGFIVDCHGDVSPMLSKDCEK